MDAKTDFVVRTMVVDCSFIVVDGLMVTLGEVANSSRVIHVTTLPIGKSTRLLHTKHKTTEG